MVAYQNRGYEMSKFEPDIDVALIDNKFFGYLPERVIEKKIILDNTFCLNNKVMNIMLENQENCRFFNITKPDGSNDWWWAYAYNLMFQAIDFDWDNDVWLCKVLGYLE